MTTAPVAPAPRLPSLSSFPWTDWAGVAGGPPRARAQCVVWGPGHIVCGGTICPSIICVSSHLVLQPSTIGNHGEANMALPRGWARRGSGHGPSGMLMAVHHLVPCPPATPLLPDHHPLTQSGFNKFIWVFNLNLTTAPGAFLPLPPWRAVSPDVGCAPESGRRSARC